MFAFPHSIRIGRICILWITSAETGPILALIEKQKLLSLRRLNQLTRSKLALKKESQISEVGRTAGETGWKTVF
jgi:hypothetical protein